MNNNDPRTVLAKELAAILEPLSRASKSPDGVIGFLADMGWPLSSISSALQDLFNKAALAAGRIDGATASPATFFESITLFFDAIEEVRRDELLPSEFISHFPRQLVDYLVSNWLIRSHSRIAFILHAARLIELDTRPAAGAWGEHLHFAVRFEDFATLLSNPLEYIKNRYAWGGAFESNTAFVNLARVLRAFSVQCDLQDFDPQAMNVLAQGALDPATVSPLAVRISLLKSTAADLSGGLDIVAVPELQSGEKSGLGIFPFFLGASGFAFPIGGTDTTCTISGQFEAEAQIGAVVRPEVPVALISTGSSPLPSSKLDILGLYQPETAQVVFGGRGNDRIELAGAETLLEVIPDPVDSEVRIVVNLRGLRLIAGGSQRDSFVSSLLPGETVIDLPMKVAWSSRDGLALNDGEGFGITFNPHISLGPVEVSQVKLSAYGEEHPGGGAGRLDISTSFSGVLGPIGFEVNHLGLALDASFKADRFDVDVGPRGPSGVAAYIDAAVVQGEGGLFTYPNEGRYAGFASLKIFDKIGVGALGILDTRLPGGADGYSLLIIISAEFPPIPLAYGFTLNGVGGLVGIHRTLVVQALQDGVRTGTLNGILFPTDLKNTARKIIEDLGKVFPPAADRFVFAPMAKIGWGTPKTLVTAELGLILELPAPVRLALVGVIEVKVPDPELPKVSLTIDVAGILDVEKKSLSIDASLRDSSVMGFPLAGDAAFRLSWGDVPQFALAIGGFHPHFAPPPGFPSLRRLSLTVSNGNNPRLYMEAYLALTANTLQFGATVDFNGEVEGFTFRGHLGFDAIVIFQPFSFKVDLSAHVTVRAGGLDLGAVNFQGFLAGPSPWSVEGLATVTILFQEVPVPIKYTFGPQPKQELPSVLVWPQLQAAFEDKRNWASQLPALTTPSVSLLPNADSDDGDLRLDPCGTLGVRQRVVPLHRNLDKFGEARIEDSAKRFDVQGVSLGGVPLDASGVKKSLVKDHFAPGQFEHLTEAQKLSRPSFELMDSGFSFSAANAVAVGPRVCADDVAYETVIVEVPNPPASPPDYTPSGAHLVSKVRQLAGERYSTHTTGAAKFGGALSPEPMGELEEETFVVASTDNLAANSAIVEATSAGAAYEAARAYAEGNPGLAGSIQVVPKHEAQSTV